MPTWSFYIMVFVPVVFMVLYIAIVLVIPSLIKQKTQKYSDDGLRLQLSDGPDSPVPFGRRMRWLALRNAAPQTVAGTLGLVETRASGWGRGLERVEDDENAVFVSPAIQGWTLVLTHALPIVTRDQDAVALPLVEKLSGEFGEAQYYSTDISRDYHAYARASNGRLIRARAWSSAGVIAETGEISDAEKGLDYSDNGGEGAVLAMAARWGLDTSFRKRHPAAAGICGYLPGGSL